MAEEKALAVVGARDEFGARELMRNAEMAAIQLAARAKAEVEARFVMAERHPRDWDDVRHRLLRDCERPAFAVAARYKVPNRGEGFTIRFAEALIQHMGNIYAPTYTVYEDEERRVIKTCVIDLERNVTWEKEIVVTKVIERKNADGREVIRRREKRSGEVVYIVAATEEELATKEASAVSKAQRTNSLRVCPPDILEEAKQRVLKIAASKVAEDPDKERKAIADAFATINVMPSHLKEFLGCELGQVAPAELVDLRTLFNAIREGSTTWREVMQQKPEPEAGGSDDGTGGESLKDRIARATGKAPAPEAPEQKKADAKPDAKPEPAKAETKAAEAKPEPPKAETKPPKTETYIEQINSFRPGLGDAKWFAILGTEGYENAEMVPATAKDEILQQMDLALRAKRAKEAAAAPPEAPKRETRARTSRTNIEMDLGDPKE